jgi:hypothetical protein
MVATTKQPKDAAFRSVIKAFGDQELEMAASIRKSPMLR